MLEVKNLTVAVKGKELVRDVSFKIKPGRILAIVGESGSGKSLIAKSILRINNEKNFSYPCGEIIYKKRDILNLLEIDIDFRGKDIALVMQDPFLSLNPVHHIKKQILEMLLKHKNMGKGEAFGLVDKMLKEVGLENVVGCNKIYPHQLSGGQRQRVMIAMSLVVMPEILIADEPTTALDPEMQQEIINLLLRLKKKFKISLIFISHDLTLMRNIADDVLVMSEGRVVEYDETEKVFKNPKQEYTKKLVNALKFSFVKHKLKDDALPVLEVKDLSISYNLGVFLQKKKLNIIDNISFDIMSGETVGLIGDSGSGKSSVARVLLKLQDGVDGIIMFNGIDISALKVEELRKLRRDMQIVFQDPFATLNPKMTIYQIIEEGLKSHQIQERDSVIKRVMEEVGLTEECLMRYPDQFSGGQRQRIAMARALSLSPKFIILDEPTASLDVTAQKELLELLIGLQKKYNLAYLFISHDHHIVDSVAHRKFKIEGKQLIRC